MTIYITGKKPENVPLYARQVRTGVPPVMISRILDMRDRGLSDRDPAGDMCSSVQEPLFSEATAGTAGDVTDCRYVYMIEICQRPPPAPNGLGCRILSVEDRYAPTPEQMPRGIIRLRNPIAASQRGKGPTVYCPVSGVRLVTPEGTDSALLKLYLDRSGIPPGQTRRAVPGLLVYAASADLRDIAGGTE